MYILYNYNIPSDTYRFYKINILKTFVKFMYKYVNL